MPLVAAISGAVVHGVEKKLCYSGSASRECMQSRGADVEGGADVGAAEYASGFTDIQPLTHREYTANMQSRGR